MRGVRGLDLVQDERWARLAWACVAEPEDPRAAALIRAQGAGAAFQGLLDPAGQPVGDYAARLADLDLEAAVRAVDRHDIRVVIPGDPAWPAALEDLEAPPYALFARGDGDLEELLDGAVAVVGARAATGYGQRVAAQLGADLAGRGVTIVSGAAFGIDAAAHRGALSVDGPTVAVLACGLDRPYPTAHAPLIAQIAERGLLLGELPVGCAPQRHRFLSRNRLIAILTLGTVVVEAALRSGSLNTARWARDHHRHVAMVPGPVTSALSAGCHEWIRIHGSSLVTDARDVLDVMGRLGLDVSDLRRAQQDLLDELSVEERAVWASVPGQRGAAVDSLARATGMAPLRLLGLLGRLSAIGLVSRDGDRWRRTRSAPGPAPRRGAPGVGGCLSVPPLSR